MPNDSVESGAVLRDTKEAVPGARQSAPVLRDLPDSPALADRRERRATVVMICMVGGSLIFKMTALIVPHLDWANPLIYAASGAIFGGLIGALQRADELEDRILHISVGAIIAAIAFALLSLAPPGPRTGRWG
jgi:hypothetical protein